MKFAEIIEGLKEGKHYRRKSWSYLCKYLDSVPVVDDNFCNEVYVLAKEELFADDWEEVE